MSRTCRHDLQEGPGRVRPHTTHTAVEATLGCQGHTHVRVTRPASLPSHLVAPVQHSSTAAAAPPLQPAVASVLLRSPLDPHTVTLLWGHPGPQSSQEAWARPDPGRHGELPSRLWVGGVPDQSWQKQ